MLYIALALENNKGHNGKNPFGKIFQSFYKEWDECIQLLMDRLPDNQPACRCYHLLERIFEISSSIENIRAEKLTHGWYGEYKSLYFELCEKFYDISTQIASSQQVVDAVRDALKRSGLTTTSKGKKRELSPERKADKADIDKIVRILRNQKDAPKSGQPQRSVTKALRILKLNPTYGPTIKRLNLSDNTWKKYVANSRKSSRNE